MSGAIASPKERRSDGSSAVVWAIARREWLIQSRDPKLPLFATVVFLILPLAIYVNTRDYATERSRAGELQARGAQTAKARGGKLTGRDVEEALRVVRVPSAGATLVRGNQSQLPAYWDVGPAGIRIGPPSHGYVSPVGELYLDIEFIVRVILGLYPLLLGIESVALERQRHTLHGLLTHPVSRLSILAGKVAAATAVCALMALGLAVVSKLVTLIVGSPASISTGSLALLFGGTFFYLLGCYLLGVVVSSLSREFQTGLTLALSVWLFLNVVSLPLTSSLSRALGGQRARSDFEAELQRAYDATKLESERRLGAELLQSAGRPDWWEIENDPKSHTRVGAALEPVWREYATHWGNDLIAREAHWHRGRLDQERMTSWMSAASPGVAFRRFAAHVCGTAARDGLRWHEAVMAYQARLYATLFGERSLLTLQVPTDQGHALMNFRRRPELTVRELPPFQPFDREPITPFELLLLPAQCVVLLLLAAGLFVRIPRS